MLNTALLLTVWLYDPMSIPTENKISHMQWKKNGVRNARTKNEYVHFLGVLEMLSLNVAQLDCKEHHEEYDQTYQDQAQGDPDPQRICGTKVSQQV